MIRRSCALIAAMAALAATLISQNAGAGPYVGGATVVFKESGHDPAVDHGLVLCNQATGTGVGGGCIPFSPNVNAVGVFDVARGPQVAFQVCVDNNGDGACVFDPHGGDLTPQQRCDLGIDDVVFSHDDDGSFRNPLSVPPPFMCPPRQGEPAKSVPFYIVFLCEGVHAPEGEAPHAHPATLGTISGALIPTSTGSGNYCGGLKDQVIKEYQIV